MYSVIFSGCIIASLFKSKLFGKIFLQSSPLMIYQNAKKKKKQALFLTIIFLTIILHIHKQFHGGGEVLLIPHLEFKHVLSSHNVSRGGCCSFICLSNFQRMASEKSTKNKQFYEFIIGNNL